MLTLDFNLALDSIIASNAEFKSGLALFRQTQILSRHKKLRNHNNEVFQTFD